MGFEPTYDGFANHCLTAWLPHRSRPGRDPAANPGGVQGGLGPVKPTANGFPLRSATCTLRHVKLALGADEKTHLVDEILRHLREGGHTVELFGAAAAQVEPWATTGVAVARAVVEGRVDSGIVCCWTGTGVSIAANKVPGARAALCGDAPTARGARKWNDANVLALSLRATSPEVAREIVEAWLAEPYGGTEDASLGVIASSESTPHS